VTDTNASIEPFANSSASDEAATLGIWIFLATEILFFGGLFVAYVVYRHEYPRGFAVAARMTDVLLGTLNTLLLLTSSFSVAVAVKANLAGNRRRSELGLIVTIALAAAFLLVKGFEYDGDLVKGLVPGSGFSLLEPGAQLFWSLYWILTGVHAVHVVIGIGVLTYLFLALRNGQRQAAVPNPEIPALYWHLVDIIWIFLYPLLYLGGRA
jgi:cytochrome c oxidase subunit III